ncbi:hypothetical protein EV421DRAFT_1853433 [Armillaria borealis]|uniref:Uncharacterized protein n=1 Tax=Armillaria borealis TaxID=47425 RepID=A0AA39IYF8_9AGAR|nr:hypothetical protein EV421DRAFT_1853433 [Armillaria borealis]
MAVILGAFVTPSTSPSMPKSVRPLSLLCTISVLVMVLPSSSTSPALLCFPTQSHYLVALSPSIPKVLYHRKTVPRPRHHHRRHCCPTDPHHGGWCLLVWILKGHKPRTWGQLTLISLQEVMGWQGEDSNCILCRGKHWSSLSLSSLPP